jgi:hypothetical protein
MVSAYIPATSTCQIGLGTEGPEKTGIILDTQVSDERDRGDREDGRWRTTMPGSYTDDGAAAAAEGATAQEPRGV